MNFDWTNPYPTVRSPVMARNVVATSHPLASQAGLRMLQQGGNAVDAAIAAAAAHDHRRAHLQRPGQRLLRHPVGRQGLHGLNSSGVAPAAWNPGYFRQKYGTATATSCRCAAGTPSPRPAPWPAGSALSKRFGKLPFADLMQPAIELAERGHGVGRITAHKWGLQVPLLQDLPGFAQAFMPRGRAPEPGERFVFKEAGATLRKIAATQGEAFYRGEIAEALVAHAKAHGGSDDPGRPGQLPARMGHADPEGLRRPHGARDPAQRPGHRRADGAGHAGPPGPRPLPGRQPGSRSTCRSRP
jgi:gamma-glutamyltranspeptidase/glutathione hydrolase